MSRPIKAKLSSIKSNALSRGLALAKISVSAGTKVATHTLGGIFASKDEKAERVKALLLSQIELLTKELGELKGSLMKAGQMLSMFGERFLPPEVNAVLKSLQSQSPPLEWKAIEKVLIRQLGKEKLALLEIDQEPLGSASLGQVHRVCEKSTGRDLVMKIQYPGVDKAIEGDLKVLRSILSMLSVIPKGPRYEELFKEVRMMLEQECDYVQELERTQEFREKLKDDPRYIVPEPIIEFSNKRVLTTTYEEGLLVDSPQVLELPQDQRDALGLAFAELFWREFFELNMVQTDPHFGNYRVRLGNLNQLVLFDFGAVRKFPKKFMEPYITMVRGAFYHDRALLDEGGKGLGFLRDDDPEELKQVFADICYLLVEPFEGNAEYDWNASDLPKRVAKKAAQMAVSFKLRTPPREVVFLDRKLGGVFIFLSKLKVKIRTREILEKYLLKNSH